MKNFLFLCMFVFIILPPVIVGIVDFFLFCAAVCQIIINSQGV
jgi:hypothetical protein